MNFTETRQILKDSFSAWVDDYAPSMGAALSYYTIFSIAPLLVIVIAIAGLAFGSQAASGAIFEQLHGMVGETGAAAVQGLVLSASKPAASEPSRVNSGTPRAKHHSQSKAVAPHRRSDA